MITVSPSHKINSINTSSITESNKDYSMIKGIIFDVDDTLNQTRRTKYKAHQYAAKYFYNLDLTDGDTDAQWGKPFNLFISLLYRNVDSVENIVKNYTSKIDQFPNRAYDDAVDVVNVLSQKYMLGLLSSGHKDLMRKDLTVAGFDMSKFTFIQTSESTPIHKPDPKVFLPILAQYNSVNIIPMNILYIGDTLDDYFSGVGAGLHFIGIADRSVPYNEFLKVCPKLIRNLSELLNILSISGR
jgi:phosphoglycolate phosphatase